MEFIHRILFVDDSEHDAELAIEALKEYNLANEVYVLRDGAEALDYLFRRGKYATRSGGEPALILLDLKMPKVDGLEVLRQVKADAVLKSIPVVIMTSSTQESDLARGYALGANAYVVKPVAFPDFVEAVKGVGAFWALLNTPPPGSAEHSTSGKS